MQGPLRGETELLDHVHRLARKICHQLEHSSDPLIQTRFPFLIYDEAGNAPQIAGLGK
jgi:hypothetical protein